MWGELSSEWGELSSESGASCLGRVFFGASCLGASCLWGELSVIRVKPPAVIGSGSIRPKTISALDSSARTIRPISLILFIAKW